ncbi:MAG TPA: hypothetical protein VNV16_12450 [Methylibium sp.]|nr:hypothetical protein [Methylibium sp.]
MPQTTPRSYRCHYTPKDRNGYPVPSDTGVLPFVQVRAANAEEAQRAAYALTGCPIASVERIEPREPRTERQAALAMGAAL